MVEPIENLSALQNADLELTIDEILELLSIPTVRTTLAYLYDHPETTIDELASVVAGKTAIDDDRIATGRDYENAHIKLHHETLPRLDDYGLLAFDPDDGTVTDVDVPTAVYTTLGVTE
ncbi:DUF7344 domain-containing protein [Natronobacterium texcoconense]|uniref:DUF7344 domain-containing protein n=1 Tax=Natronobacterium texcoconense TaxID=1095778 RepID=A0A1H1BWU2_NATTX|nr:hypothetical protein [Natronobacterium texcoconense]SDQ56379.1 hypothetical protein SAMN04489842_1183 [Natronobacterium texcoconense]